MSTDRFFPIILSAALLLLPAACSQEGDSGQPGTVQAPAAAAGETDAKERSASQARVEPTPAAAAAPQVFDPSRPGAEARSARRDDPEIGIKPASPGDRDRYYDARERAKRR